MTLYSVTIHRKKIITKYLDKKGRKSETFEELITETYHDLPYSTCLGYKKLDPDAVISQQAAPVHMRDTFKGKFTVRGKSAESRYVEPKPSKTAKDSGEKSPAMPKQQGYADVVNKMMKDVA